MRLRTCRIASVAVLMTGYLLVGSVLLPSGAASAAGAGDPVIVSPADGSDVSSGFYGPFTVDFSSAPIDTYDLMVKCGDFYWNDTYVYDGSLPTYSWTTDPIAGFNDCSLTVDSSGTGTAHAAAAFTVEDPPVRVSGSSLSEATFYPEVHDGYRDDTTLTYTLTEQATAAITVSNAQGQLVRSTKQAAQASSNGTNSWTWTGRNDAGNLLAPGGYTINLVVTDGWGNTDSVSKAVTVATGVRTVTTSQSLYGSQYSGLSRDGLCNAHVGYTTLRMRCLGGRYVIARYHFWVPASATNLRYRYSGYRLLGDQSRRGVIATAGTRISPNRAMVQVKVTRWRAFALRNLRLVYERSVRI